jgi:hypothetical protein
MVQVHPGGPGGELFPENLDATGLSWSFRELNTVFAFGKGGFTWYMLVQLLLAVYYIVGYYMNLGTTMEYYSWPPTLDHFGDWTTDTFMVRSAETSFVCEEQTFYIRCEGPKYDPSDEYFDESSYEATNCIRTSPTGFNVLMSSVYVVFLLGVVFFVGAVFNNRKYNQLLGLVQFKHDNDGQNNTVKPVKFGVAFTLFCNFAKGIPSIFQRDLCGRWARGFPDPTSILADPPTVMDATIEVANLVMGVAFILVFIVGFHHACCGAAEEKDCTCLDIFIMRGILLVCVACSLISRVAGFNFEINFDFDYIQWATLSVVSLIDVTVSAGSDLYLTWCA